jgi:hypothetical protein
MNLESSTGATQTLSLGGLRSISPEKNSDDPGYLVCGQHLADGNFSAGDNYRRRDTDMIFFPNSGDCVMLLDSDLAGRK